MAARASDDGKEAPEHVSRLFCDSTGEQPLWTFDKGAAKVTGAQLIRAR